MEDLERELMARHVENEECLLEYTVALLLGLSLLIGMGVFVAVLARIL